jgi:hypothetical protein
VPARSARCRPAGDPHHLAAVVSAAHEPIWPHGLCSGCGLLWPCAPAVDELLAEHGTGLQLSAALWTLFDKAAQAVPTAPWLVLYEQCIRQPLRYVVRLTAGADR